MFIKTIKRLAKDGAIHPPKWMADGLSYLCIMGSAAYGVALEDSDLDLYGFGIPPREFLFPWENGYVIGFDHEIPKWDQWQEHGIKDPSQNKEYDFTVFNIVRYFDLLRQCNPNIIDSCWVPDNLVVHRNKVWTPIYDQREIFLHKGCFYKFRGYAHSQKHKILVGRGKTNPKRAESIQEYGYDTKFAMHLVRLLLECEQILTNRSLDLQRDREVLKAIRKGEWSIDDIFKWADEKDILLEKLYHESTLPDRPDNDKIRQLLIDCLEMHYGSLAKTISQPNKEKLILQQIKTLLESY